MDDAVTMANLAAAMRAEKKQFSIRNMTETSYDDLLKGPVVLIGAYNNGWTMHFNQSMRYQFAQNSDNFQWISDRNDPNVKLGMEKVNQEIYGPQEYALVARVYEQETRQPAIFLGGVTPAGTLAAGEFVTNPQYLKDFLKTLPANWQTKNIELVITTNVIDNEPGPPHVVASAIW